MITIEQLYAIRVYEKQLGPLKTLSMLNKPDAYNVYLLESSSMQEAQTATSLRFSFEELMLKIFVAKGGRPRQSFPYYFHIANEPHQDILAYFKDPEYIKIPLSAFDKDTISFTFGNSGIAFFRKDNHPTRRKIYLLDEFVKILNEYGTTVNYNNINDFLEMHLWDRDILNDYKRFVYTSL